MKIIIMYICMLSLGISQSIAANRECSIYEKIIHDIHEHYTRNMKMQKVPIGGIDPESTVFIEDSTQYVIKPKFCIETKMIDFDSITVKYWFYDFLDDKTLKNKVFVNRDVDSFLNCKFSFDYDYIDSDEQFIKYQEDSESRDSQGKLVIHMAVKVAFSKVLFPSKNKALVFAKITAGNSRNDVIFGYIFERKNNQWKITKRNIEVR